jgi:hypothetical protein
MISKLRCQREPSMKAHCPSARAAAASLTRIRASARELGSAHRFPGNTVSRSGWNFLPGPVPRVKGSSGWCGFQLQPDPGLQG